MPQTLQKSRSSSFPQPFSFSSDEICSGDGSFMWMDVEEVPIPFPDLPTSMLRLTSPSQSHLTPKPTSENRSSLRLSAGTLLPKLRRIGREFRFYASPTPHAPTSFFFSFIPTPSADFFSTGCGISAAGSFRAMPHIEHLSPAPWFRYWHTPHRQLSSPRDSDAPPHVGSSATRDCDGAALFASSACFSGSGSSPTRLR